MESKSTLGPVLTIVGLLGIALAVAGIMNDDISRSLFAGVTLLSCLLFLGGVSLLRDQLA